MGKLLKPFLGPVVLVMAEIGLGMTSYKNDWLGGILIGLAIFWLIFALLSHKAFLKKFPGILEWVPFLDPTGGFSTAEQLTGKFITGQSFNISSIVHDGIIKNRTFDDCDIYGPAVLAPDGVGIMHKCTFYGEAESVFIVVAQQMVLGPIHLLDCNFKNCRFYKVGFIGNQKNVDEWLKGAKNVAR